MAHRTLASDKNSLSPPSHERLRLPQMHRSAPNEDITGSFLISKHRDSVNNDDLYEQGPSGVKSLNRSQPSISIDQDASFTPATVVSRRHSRDTDRSKNVNTPPLDDHYSDHLSEKGRARSRAPSQRTNSNPSSNNSRPTGSNPRRDSDNWTESDRVVARRNLTELDVAALILNKMVGTGIFTTPGTVLAYTKSRNVAITLWTIGGVWTTLFLLVYLEFGSALPFNGGELIYLDEIYYRPELLATILFSGFFLTLGNSYGNSVAFAKNILLCADQDVLVTSELDARLVRFIAVVVVTLVCLIHYFSSRAGLFLNKALFWYKTMLLLVVFAAGMAYVKKNGSQWNNYNQHVEKGTNLDSLAAMVSIFYTYQGWENANYVTGEIRALDGRTPARTLKWGAFIATSTVWLLYVLVTLTYYMVLDFDSITDKHSDLGMALHFAPKVFNASLGMKVCLAISAFGNILAITYTSSKVKQAIAIQRILPFYRFFSRDLDTPKGALVLHWISSVLLIAICPTTSDGYVFATGLFTYGHLIMSGFVTAGLYFLERRLAQSPGQYRLTFFKYLWVLFPVPIIFAGGNIFILYFSARPKDSGKIPRFWWPATFGFIMLGSFVYWAVMMLMTVEVKWNRRGEKGKRTIGSLIGFQVKVHNADDHAPEGTSQDILDSLVQSRQDGSRRRVEYEFSGFFASCGKAFRKVQNFLAQYMF